MIEIKDLPPIGMNEPTFKIKYEELSANIFDNGRKFCAISYDGQWCCIGIIINWKNNLDNFNPMVQVNAVFTIFTNNCRTLPKTEPIKTIESNTDN